MQTAMQLNADVHASSNLINFKYEFKNALLSLKKVLDSTFMCTLCLNVKSNYFFNDFINFHLAYFNCSNCIRGFLSCLTKESKVNQPVTKVNKINYQLLLYKVLLIIFRKLILTD